MTIIELEATLRGLLKGKYSSLILSFNDGMWELQWYPDTPVRFYRIAASSLQALIEALDSEWKA